jgi:ABC-type uncharacterized transport system permease subunit
MENTFHHELKVEPIRNRILKGVFYILAGIGIYLLFAHPATPGLTTLELNPGGAALLLQPLTFSSSGLLAILVITTIAAGFLQLTFSFKQIHDFLGKWYLRWSTFVLILAVGCFMIAFITWAASGKSLNIAGLLVTMLTKSVPITLAALAGILCERAGIWNIAIEGMMLTGAMTACLVASVTGSLWMGLLAALVSGALMGALHAVLSIKYKINQIISGTVINILATGLTSYVSQKFLQTYQPLNNSGIFPAVRIPILADIPFIGPILFNNSIYIYAMFFFIILMTIMLSKTRAGLRMRSVGEHPKAADTLGINVIRTRYIYVLLSGMMAGFAGSYFTTGAVGRFDPVMTGGRGFIGLAAMIFGNYMPLGGFGAGLLFGFFDSLKDRLSILNVNIPSSFLLMAPYLATMIVLAGIVGRSHPPAAGGQPYEKE